MLHCFLECTKNALPLNGIDVIYMGGHMHFAGDHMKVDRIRGDQVETIYSLRKWDFDRQFASAVHYKLRPNDSLRVSCCMYNRLTFINHHKS